MLHQKEYRRTNKVMIFMHKQPKNKYGFSWLKFLQCHMITCTISIWREICAQFPEQTQIWSEATFSSAATYLFFRMNESQGGGWHGRQVYRSSESPVWKGLNNRSLCLFPKHGAVSIWAFCLYLSPHYWAWLVKPSHVKSCMHLPLCWGEPIYHGVIKESFAVGRAGD